MQKHVEPPQSKNFLPTSCLLYTGYAPFRLHVHMARHPETNQFMISWWGCWKFGDKKKGDTNFHCQVSKEAISKTKNSPWFRLHSINHLSKRHRRGWRFNWSQWYNCKLKKPTFATNSECFTPKPSPERKKTSNHPFSTALFLAGLWGGGG